MNQNEENNQPNKENNPFSLPGDYFNAFSKKMMFKIELADELKEFKVLSSIDKIVPFVTPENYFETRSELSEYPNLLALKNKHVFDVPQNYFKDSAIAIQSKIETANELKAYPVLASISKQNAFVTPDAYFEQLSDRLNGKNANYSTTAKIIHLVFSKQTVYALAAMLVLSLGLYFYNSKTEAANTDCNTLACLERNDILKANQLNSFDEEALIEAVNTEELQKNLNKTLKEENKNTNDQQNTEDYVLENVDVNDITDEI